MGIGDWKWGVRTGLCVRLSQPRFRHPFQLGHQRRCDRPSSSRCTEGRQQLRTNQGYRCRATNRWRGMGWLLGVRNPRAAEPGGSCRGLQSFPCPYPSSLLCIFHREFERQSEGEGECMLQPDLRASERGHQRKMTSKQAKRAIRRASATHCWGRNRNWIESLSERIRRRLVRGRERRGRVGSDSRCGG